MLLTEMNRPSHEKSKALRRVIYCLSMVLHTYSYLKSHPSKPKTLQGKIEKNCHLESFLLHIRNLNNFFLSKKKNYSDDINAADFSDKIDGESIIDRDLNNRIDKFLSHLTYHEIIRKKPDWNEEEITKNLFSLYADFLEDKCFANYSLEPKVEKKRSELAKAFRRR